MELKEVDPWEVTVSELNERQVGESDPELVKNVEKMGLIQPPIVRTLDGEGTEARMGAKYAAVIGGRRVDAAQEADLDSIPVVVMDEWNDGEALAASITENIDAFRQEVSKQDRAVALQRLMELNNWTQQDAAEELGVGNMTISNWLEPLKWEEGTSINPEYEVEEEDTANIDAEVEDTAGSKLNTDVDLSNVATDTIQQIRRMTGGGKEGEQLVQKVEKEGLSQHDIREMKRRVDRGESPEDAIEQVATEKSKKGEIRVQAEVTFTGDYAQAIDTAARDRGASENQIVHAAVEEWLEREGYI